MFGQPKNDQDDHQMVNPEEHHDAPQADASAQPFNPALPTADNSFGDAPASAPVINSDQPAATADSDSLISAESIASNDLMEIKQQALNQLSPLVGHLDQTPVEKFRTTMMLIQASDNQDLVKDAYAAAQQITDEKAKAQALLDIVNEINYFTQHQEK